MQSLFAGVIHQVAQIEQQRLAQILDSFFAQPVLQRKECMTGKTQRMEAAASREPFVNLFTQPSARYVINILFFNWAYIVCGILFSALCIVFLSKARKVTAA